jgi:hypothetical protein
MRTLKTRKIQDPRSIRIVLISPTFSYTKLTKRKRKATGVENNDKHHGRNKGGPDPGGVPAHG